MPWQWFPLVRRHEPADLVTVTHELERRDHLNVIGGPAQLSSLLIATPIDWSPK